MSVILIRLSLCEWCCFSSYFYEITSFLSLFPGNIFNYFANRSVGHKFLCPQKLLKEEIIKKSSSHVKSDLVRFGRRGLFWGSVCLSVGFKKRREREKERDREKDRKSERKSEWEKDKKRGRRALLNQKPPFNRSLHGNFSYFLRVYVSFYLLLFFRVLFPHFK